MKKLFKQHKILFIFGSVVALILLFMIVIVFVSVKQITPLLDETLLSTFTSTANTVVSVTETAVITDEIEGQSTEGTFCYTIKYLADNGYLNFYFSAADYGEEDEGYSGYVKVVKNDSSEYQYYITLVDYTNGYNIELYNYTTNGILSTSYEKINITLSDNFVSGPSSYDDLNFDSNCSSENTYR